MGLVHDAVDSVSHFAVGRIYVLIQLERILTIRPNRTCAWVPKAKSSTERLQEKSRIIERRLISATEN
jgi:hypothetical protein